MAERRKKKSKASPLKGKRMAKHGAGKEWQFRFEKDETTEVLNDLLHAKSREDLLESFGLRIDDDLAWGHSMRDIVRNILVTIARGQLKAMAQVRKGGSVNEASINTFHNNLSQL